MLNNDVKIPFASLQKIWGNNRLNGHCCVTDFSLLGEENHPLLPELIGVFMGPYLLAGLGNCQGII